MTNVTKQYNLQPLKKCRLKSGDVFAMLIDGEYIFGRVIRDNLSFQESPFGGSNLIYIYNFRSPSDSMAFSELTPNNLLIPPLYISNVLWSRGYVNKVANLDISKNDLLPQHCFYSPTQNKYYDEKGIELKHKTEPCGEWVCIVGLDHADDKISDALGIKRAPLVENSMFYTSGKGEKIWLKQARSELKKYSNYEEIIEQYPEVIAEDEI